MERAPVASSKERPFSIGQLTRLVKGTLEGLPRMYVVGEISNFKRAGSGHWYFSLKDAEAQVRCNMWRSAAARVPFQPADGAEVLVSGSLNVYAPRGEYSLVVESMEELGKGRLRQAFERLKARLQAEGLFDARHKKPLPLLPTRIGVVTSPTGAAIRDILRVLHQRFAGVQVLVFPARVQGEGAAEEIALGIGYLDARGDCDLIIAGRGGGSEEDLWCFNEEIVARAIFAAQTPIISAVGHEVDFTIADFCADLRAATPSNAAEIAIRSRLEYKQTLTVHLRNMERGMQRLLLRLRNRINISESHPIFVRVRNRLNDTARRLHEAEHRMDRAVTRKLSRAQMRLVEAGGRIRADRLSARARDLQGRLERAQTALEQLTAARLEKATAAAATLSLRLEDLSPLKVLNRGYAAVYNSKAQLVRRPDDVSFGEVLRLRLAEGEVRARVIDDAPPAIQENLFD